MCDILVHYFILVIYTKYMYTGADGRRRGEEELMGEKDATPGAIAPKGRPEEADADKGPRARETDDEGKGSRAGSEAETEEEFLARYDPRAFPPVAVTVDIVLATVTERRLAALLVERGEHPARGTWALPGGFVGPDEDLAEAASATLAHETGVERLPAGVHLEQLGTYGSPPRDPRMRVVSVAYLAFAPNVAPPPRRASGMGGRTARLWPADLLGEDAGAGSGTGDEENRVGNGIPRLAFDHVAIARDGVERARAKLEYTTVGLSFVAEPFTLGDLRRVYEAVWGARLDPSNFRRAVLENPGFVLTSGEGRRAEGGRGRPGDLYRRGPAFWLERPIRRPTRDRAAGGTAGGP